MCGLHWGDKVKKSEFLTEGIIHADAITTVSQHIPEKF